MEDSKMKFAIGTNFDPELFDIIEKYDKDKKIYSLFGKLNTDILGGGRPSVLTPQLSFKQLRNYIDTCNRRNLSFNYLINPMCLDNREVHPGSHRKIIRHIGKLVETGIHAITVNSFYLCKLIKTQFPHIRVSVGLYAGVFALQQIKYWENVGADEITLVHLLNRNFHLLKEILKHTKTTGTNVRLIANNVCLHYCPYSATHGTMQSHASQKNHFSNAYVLDYCLIKCLHQRLKNPAHLIAGHWIRPEDIHYYETLKEKTGNYNLSFKLLERTAPTTFLANVLKAYLSRSHEGNLIDILDWPSKSKTRRNFSLKTFLSVLLSGYNLQEMARLDTILLVPPIYIDNKKLDGFLDKFIEKNRCIEKICGHEGDIENKRSCHHCKQWADKVITYDKKELADWMVETEAFLKSLYTSKMFL